VANPTASDTRGFRLSTEDEVHTDNEHLRARVEQQQLLQISEEKPKEKEVVNVSPPARVAEAKVSILEVADESISQPKKKITLEGSVVSAGDAISTNDALQVEAPWVELAPDSESLPGIFASEAEDPLLVDGVITADIEAPGSEFVEQWPDNTNEAIPNITEITAHLEADPVPARSETVSSIIEAFAMNKIDDEYTSAGAEPIVKVIEFLPEDTQIAMSEYLAEAEPEAVLAMQEMLAAMAPVLERYEALIVDGLEESVEAEQIEAVLMEWHETFMQTIGRPIDPEKAAQFIVLLQQTILEHQAEHLESMKDDGTHEHKLGLPNLQTVLKLKDGLELELGRLTVRRLAAQLA